MSKERVDVTLVARGLVASREQAKRLVMAGLVYSGTDRVDKPGTQVDDTIQLSVKGALHPYVSRGGLKLEKALQKFPVSLLGKVVIDIGASTGGFTDCALQHGASLVYAVDVGYGQLAWSLREDQRVKVMERINFRYVDIEQFSPLPTVAVMDVSFISIGKLLPKIAELLRPGDDVITLIKPQFEAGQEFVGKGGIVRDENVHMTVINRVIEQAKSHGFCVHGLDFSPIKGGEGNIEFLLWMQKIDVSGQDSLCHTYSFSVEKVVQHAHMSDFS